MNKLTDHPAPSTLSILEFTKIRCVCWMQDPRRSKTAAIRAVWAGGELDIETVRGNGYWATDQPGGARADSFDDFV